MPDPARLTLPPHLPDLPGVRNDLARYIAEVEHLDADPGELVNLAGNKEYAQIERELKEALTEKMVLDWDFLPTPLR